MDTVVIDLETPLPDIKTRGIGRAMFVGINFILALLLTGVDELLPAARPVTNLIMVVITLALIVFRLRNIGSNGWWALLFFVPIVNLVLLFRCLAFPEGYRNHRKLDFAAWVVTVFTVLLIVLILGRIILY